MNSVADWAQAGMASPRSSGSIRYCCTPSPLLFQRLLQDPLAIRHPRAIGFSIGNRLSASKSLFGNLQLGMRYAVGDRPAVLPMTLGFRIPHTSSCRSRRPAYRTVLPAPWIADTPCPPQTGGGWRTTCRGDPHRTSLGDSRRRSDPSHHGQIARSESRIQYRCAAVAYPPACRATPASHRPSMLRMRKQKRPDEMLVQHHEVRCGIQS